MKLNKRNTLFISFMLFSMFFGAGNLIFPPFLGQSAGAQTLSALLGQAASFVVSVAYMPRFKTVRLDARAFRLSGKTCGNIVHLVSKLCAIGYMLMDCKDKANARAVVAMDGKQSEVGASNGRSGKSLVGEAFKHVRKSVVINGKNSELAKDNFLWEIIFTS